RRAQRGAVVAGRRLDEHLLEWRVPADFPVRDAVHRASAGEAERIGRHSCALETLSSGRRAGPSRSISRSLNTSGTFGSPESQLMVISPVQCRKYSRLRLKPPSGSSDSSFESASTCVGDPYGARPITLYSSPYFLKPRYCVMAR